MLNYYERLNRIERLMWVLCLQIYDDTPYLRRETSAAVRKAISGDLSTVQTEQMFAAYFPLVTEHKHHPLVEKV